MWNNLNKSIWIFEGLSIIKKIILKSIGPTPNNMFNCHNPKGIKLIKRLGLGLSDLYDDKFKQKFSRFVKSHLQM